MSDNQPTFQIEKIYVKDLSLEIPSAPQVFIQTDSPQLEVQISNDSAQFSDALFEVSVTVTVTARAGEKTLFLAEATQAGIFTIRGVSQEELDPLLGQSLFPNLFHLCAKGKVWHGDDGRFGSMFFGPLGIVRTPLLQRGYGLEHVS